MGAVTEGLLPRPADDTTSWGPVTWRFAGDGDKPIAITAIETMPDWLACIVTDPRTLNQTIFISEDEVTLTEVWDIVAKQPGGAAILEKKSPVSSQSVYSVSIALTKLPVSRRRGHIAMAGCQSGIRERAILADSIRPGLHIIHQLRVCSWGQHSRER
jgi:hypothetical protein